MRRINQKDEPRSEHERYHWSDCERIQSALLNYGIEASINECYDVWDEYSDKRAAGWLCLPDSDDDIYYEISHLINQRLED